MTNLEPIYNWVLNTLQVLVFIVLLKPNNIYLNNSKYLYKYIFVCY
jgi:hypothetical protein